MKTKSSKKNIVGGLLIIFGIAIIVGIIILSYSQVTEHNTSPLTHEEYANLMIETCQDADSNQRCYDVEIPKLMDHITLEEVFEVTKIIQSKDPTYWFCHELGHNVSEREYNKDPSKWKEVAARCPVAMCSNGCLHGAIQKHFIASSLNNVQMEEMMPVAQDLCEKREEWNPTSQAQSSCYHELGHLSMYLTGSDINESAKFCDTVGIKKDGRNYLQTCYEGIFMQVFEPRETEDFGLIYDLVPIKENLTKCEKYTTGIEKGACWKSGWIGKTEEFCDQFTNKVRDACYREAWIIEDDLIETAQGIDKYCTYSDNPSEIDLCYNKLVFALMSKFEFDSKKVLNICFDFEGIRKSDCITDVASRMVETDYSLASDSSNICELIESDTAQEKCFERLIYYAEFSLYPESQELNDYCNSLPSPFKERCKE